MKLRDLERAATPGPWREWGDLAAVAYAGVVKSWDQREANAALIAAARNALPLLLDVVDAARSAAFYEGNLDDLAEAIAALDESQK